VELRQSLRLHRLGFGAVPEFRRRPVFDVEALLALATFVEAHVHRQARHPRLERASPLEAVYFLVRPYKRLLGGVFGILPIPEDAEANPENERLVANDELGESLSFPGPNPRYKRLVVWFYNFRQGDPRYRCCLFPSQAVYPPRNGKLFPGRESSATFSGRAMSNVGKKQR
jgi:hypothetical protein